MDSQDAWTFLKAIALAKLLRVADPRSGAALWAAAVWQRHTRRDYRKTRRRAKPLRVADPRSFRSHGGKMRPPAFTERLAAPKPGIRSPT